MEGGHDNARWAPIILLWVVNKRGMKMKRNEPPKSAKRSEAMRKNRNVQKRVKEREIISLTEERRERWRRAMEREQDRLPTDYEVRMKARELGYQSWMLSCDKILTSPEGGEEED